MTASTAVCSRLLTPRDFGIAALVLTVVALGSVMVGAPFEEALAQRSVLRRPHLRAALTGSWLIGLVLVAASIPAGWLLARLYHEPQITTLLPVAMCSVFFSGHSDVMTGLARRLRRFSDVSAATLFGHLIGIPISVVMAMTGFGLWALIAQRLLVVIIRAAVLQWRIDIIILPQLSLKNLSGMGRYGTVTLLDRLFDSMTYVAFNNLVGAFYGLTTLGYVNVAMRLIEPIRGAIGATSHNLAFSWFAAVQNDRSRLLRRTSELVSLASLAIVPIFVGLAAVMPTLLPLVSGPGWDESVKIAVCLGIGSAIAVPSQLIYSAFSATARPEFSLVANCVAFAGTLAVLVCTVSLGPISVGLSRIAGDVLQAAIAIGVSPRNFGWSCRDRFLALAPAWGLAIVMGGLVGLLGVVPPILDRSLTLAVLVIFGVATYAVLLFAFARSDLVRMIAVWPARRANNS
ncbi:oligosaccharide flippase family protein [Rhodopseudomonas sp.]|uniref:oligosaccharide flippase family protein n=1 Tax=Rhodopseudomonas sp. TaxID=1078 RepID=UPI0025DC0D2B|nr:oligosaccharide flippase family protein [Rhodopseudomonas sp.]